MKLKYIYYLVIYSLKQFVIDFFDLLAELKKPRTWVYLAGGVTVYGIFKQDLRLVQLMLPVILAIYLIRQQIDGAYKRDRFNIDLFKGKDSDIVIEYYNKYCKHCQVIKKEPLEFKVWKEEEIKKKSNG